MNWVDLSYKNIYRSKRRSLLTLVSLGVVAFTITMMGSMITGMQDDLIQNIKDLKTGDFYIQNKDLEKYQLFNPLSLLVDSDKVKPLLKDYKNITVNENMDFGLTIYKNGEMQLAKGIAFSMKNQEDKLKRDRSIFKIYENQGHLPLGDKEVAVALNLAQKNDIKVGDRLAVLTQTASRSLNGSSYTVSAIVYFSVGAYNGDTLIFDIPGGQKLLKTNGVTRMMVETGSDDLSKEIIAKIAPILGEEYAIKGWYESQDTAVLKIQAIMLKIITFIFFSIGGSIIINTSMMNILERRKEIGMMSSMGASVKEVRYLFFLESLWLGLIGTIIGIGLAVVLSMILGHTGWDLIGDGISKEMGIPVSSVLYPRVALGDLIQTFTFAVIISSIISYIPTGRVAKISPAEAFRN